MPIYANIRQIDTLCSVSLQRTNMAPGRREGMGDLTYRIPEDLAREALRNTQSQVEAEEYVQDQVDSIVLEWPDSVGSILENKQYGAEGGSIS